jgi:general L-amino acid transport system permease protein
MTPQQPASGGVRPSHPGRHAAVPPWRDRRVQRVGFQVFVVLIVGLIGLLLWNNLTSAMARTNLTFGLGFLSQTAGFEISESLIPFAATNTYGRAIQVGLLNTLYVSILGIILSTILGVIVGIARLSRNWLLNKIAAGFVELMRNTPLLVQLFILYFAVLLQLPGIADSITLPGAVFLNQRGLFLPRPDVTATFPLWLGFILAGTLAGLIGWQVSSRREAAGRPTHRAGTVGLVALVALPIIGWLVAGGSPVAFEAPVRGRFNFAGGLSLSPEFLALLVGLVIYTAAFIGEVVRGGIQAVRRGQIEAAYAVGLSEMQTLRLIIFPQAMRIIVPPLTSQYLNLAKNSSLAIAIGFPDLFNVSSTVANQTGQPVSVIVLVMAVYLGMSLFTSLLMNLYNRRVQVLER